MIIKRRAAGALLALACLLPLAMSAVPVRASATPAGEGGFDAAGASGYLENATHNAYTPQEFGGAPRQYWSRRLPGPVSYAVVDSGRAFVAVHGWVYAISTATGRTLWAIDAGIAHDMHYTTLGLTAADGVLLVSEVPDGRIHAYDETSGQQLWQLAGVAKRRGFEDVVSPGNGVFYTVEARNGYIEARRVDDGGLLWAVQTPNGGLVAMGSTVYASSASCGDDVALDATTGALVWRSPQTCNRGLPGQSTVVTGDRLYDQRRTVYTTASGDVAGAYRGNVSPIIVGRTLLTHQHGELVATDTSTRATKWRFSGDMPGDTGDVVSHAIVVGSTVFAVTAQRNLYQLDLADGRPMADPVRLPAEYAGRNPSTRAAMSFGDGELLVPTGDHLTAFVGDAYTGPIAAPAPSISVTLPAATDAPAADYRQDARHDGANGAGALRGPVTQAWTSKSPGVMTYPLIAGGFVYTTERRKTGDYLVALSAATGRRRWQVSLPTSEAAPGQALPVYDNGDLFVVTNTDRLYKVDADTGQVKYAKELAVDGQPINGTYAPPVAYRGALYLTGHDAYSEVYLAVRESDGKVRWTTEVTGTEIGSPAVTSDGVYSAGCAELELGRTTGAPVWTADGSCDDTDAAGLAPTAVHAGLVWDVDNETRSYTVSMSSGHGQSAFTTTVEPALVGSVALVASDDTLYAEDISTRRVIWSRSRDFVDTPVVAGSAAYDVAADGRVVGMDVRSGKIVFESAPNHPTSHDPDNLPSGPAVADGVLVVPEGQYLVAYAGTTNAEHAPSPARR